MFTLAKLNIYHQNVRGLRTKTDTFSRNILLNGYDIITVTETWLLDSVSDTELFDTRYSVWRRDRDYKQMCQTRGGGVAVATKKSLNVECRSDWQSSAEDLWVSVTYHNKNRNTSRIHICTIYLCAENKGNSFDQQLDNFLINLEKLTNEHPNDMFLILGDFNMSSIRWNETEEGLQAYNLNDNNSRNFIDTLSLCNLNQFNNIKNNFGRILDLVLSNDSVTVLHCDDPLVPEDPYHKALCINLPFFSIQTLPLSSRTMYAYKRGNFSQINEALSNYDWDTLLHVGDLESVVKSFYKILYELRDRFVPLIKNKSNKYPSWYSIPLIKAIKEKYKHLVKYRTYKNLEDRLSFDILRTRVKLLEDNCYSYYINSLEESLTKDSQLFWSHVKRSIAKRATSFYPKSMTYSHSKSDTGTGICELFSSYFHSTYQQVTSSSSHVQPGDSITTDIYTIEFIPQVIEKALKSLKPNKSAGPDEIPAIFLISCAHSLSVPLSILFRRSISEGYMPSLWKSAYITPIHKNGPRNMVENYRPISKLCLVAKVLERIVYNQCYNVLKSQFSQNQHGFLKGRSTVTNLALFLDFLTDKLDSRDQVDAVYTDYSKAFDRIDHILLLKKLASLGIRGDLFRWFSSYINNRLQTVVLNGFKSNWMAVPSGVPQGSLLGPFLFTIFIHDIDLCFIHSKFLLFADDLKVFRTVNNVKDAELLQADLFRLDDYCIQNKLDLNVLKCNSISFTRKREPFLYDYILKHQNLNRTDIIRDLGVLLDTKLIFDYHIDAIVTKAFKALGFIIRVSKPFKKMKTIKILYCSLVRSQLEYACQIWNPAYHIYINKLESIQKKFIRFLKHKFHLPKTSYEISCSDLHLVPLHTRRNIADVCLLLNIVRGSIDSPELLTKLDLFVPSRLPRHKKILHVPLTKTKNRFNYFIIRVSRLLNSVYNDPEIDLFYGNMNSVRRNLVDKLLHAR